MIRLDKYIGVDVSPSNDLHRGSGFRRQAGDGIYLGKAATILQFIHGLRGDLHITLKREPGPLGCTTCWKPDVTEIVVCDLRRNALLKQGNKSDKVDARTLAELLRAGCSHWSTMARAAYVP